MAPIKECVQDLILLMLMMMMMVRGPVMHYLNTRHGLFISRRAKLLWSRDSDHYVLQPTVCSTMNCWVDSTTCDCM